MTAILWPHLTTPHLPPKIGECSDELIFHHQHKPKCPSAPKCAERLLWNALETGGANQCENARLPVITKPPVVLHKWNETQYIHEYSWDSWSWVMSEIWFPLHFSCPSSWLLEVLHHFVDHAPRWALLRHLHRELHSQNCRPRQNTSE